MRSTSLLDQYAARTGMDPDGTAQELRELLQTHRQTFDMAIDEVVEGLQAAQQVLNVFKVACFAVPTPGIAPTSRLQVQRASHHCNRLIAEVTQHLQSFSQELQVLLVQETPSISSQEKTARRTEEMRV